MADPTLQRTNDTVRARRPPSLHRLDDPRRAGTHFCFRLPDEHDLANATLVLDELRAFAARHPRPHELHIDSSTLAFIDGRGRSRPLSEVVAVAEAG